MFELKSHIRIIVTVKKKKRGFSFWATYVRLKMAVTRTLKYLKVNQLVGLLNCIRCMPDSNLACHRSGFTLSLQATLGTVSTLTYTAVAPFFPLTLTKSEHPPHHRHDDRHEFYTVIFLKPDPWKWKWSCFVHHSFGHPVSCLLPRWQNVHNLTLNNRCDL